MKQDYICTYAVRLFSKVTNVIVSANSWAEALNEFKNYIVKTTGYNLGYLDIKVTPISSIKRIEV